MASKRRLRRNACGKKRRYDSQAQALAAIKALARSGCAVGYLTPYRCAFCHAFHFGHPPKRVRQALRSNHA